MWVSCTPNGASLRTPCRPVVFELALDAVLEKPIPVFASVPKLQPVQRDIAVVVDDSVTHQRLMDVIHAANTGGLLRDAQLFDVYRPKTAKGAEVSAEQDRSLAVRLTLNSDEATLTEDQIEAAVHVVVQSMVVELGARQRV